MIVRKQKPSSKPTALPSALLESTHHEPALHKQRTAECQSYDVQNTNIAKADPTHPRKATAIRSGSTATGHDRFPSGEFIMPLTRDKTSHHAAANIHCVDCTCHTCRAASDMNIQPLHIDDLAATWLPDPWAGWVCAVIGMASIAINYCLFA